MYCPFLFRCLQKLHSLPKLECNVTDCVWYIRNSEQKNCFWCLANSMYEIGSSFTIEEIARIEGISEEDVDRLLQSGIQKVAKEMKEYQDYKEFLNNS